MNRPFSEYVQPVAAHLRHPDRSVVRTASDDWYLWFGHEKDLVAIPAELAAWVLDQPEMEWLPDPLFWFDPATLLTAACQCPQCTGVS